jgi:hypothetical protein
MYEANMTVNIVKNVDLCLEHEMYFVSWTWKVCVSDTNLTT